MPGVTVTLLPSILTELELPSNSYLTVTLSVEAANSIVVLEVTKPLGAFSLLVTIKALTNDPGRSAAAVVSATPKVIESAELATI